MEQFFGLRNVTLLSTGMGVKGICVWSENQQSHVLAGCTHIWSPSAGDQLLSVIYWLQALDQTHCQRPSCRNVTVLSVVLSGFLDSTKRKRVRTGELIWAPRNVARLHSLWPLTVVPHCPLLLCCCSHPRAAKCWHTTQSIVWHRAKFRVMEGRGGEGRGIKLLHKALLTKQQSEKMHTIAIHWVL